jgi:hypothetical protein
VNQIGAQCGGGARDEGLLEENLSEVGGWTLRVEVGGWKLDASRGGQIDHFEGTAVRHDEEVLVLRRDRRQARGQLADVLPAAGVGLIDEPAVDSNTHGM